MVLDGSIHSHLLTCAENLDYYLRYLSLLFLLTSSKHHQMQYRRPIKYNAVPTAPVDGPSEGGAKKSKVVYSKRKSSKAKSTGATSTETPPPPPPETSSKLSEKEEGKGEVEPEVVQSVPPAVDDWEDAVDDWDNADVSVRCMLVDVAFSDLTHVTCYVTCIASFVAPYVTCVANIVTGAAGEHYSQG